MTEPDDPAPVSDLAATHATDPRLLALAATHGSLPAMHRTQLAAVPTPTLAPAALDADTIRGWVQQGAARAVVLGAGFIGLELSLIHISEPTRPY